MLVPYNISGMGDMNGWNPVKAIGKGIKSASKIVTAPVKLSVRGAKAAGRLIPKAATFGTKLAFAPITLSAKVSKNIATTAARALGGAVGTLVKTPFSAVGAAGKGFLSPFKKQRPTGEQIEQAAYDTQQREEAMQPQIPRQEFFAPPAGQGGPSYGGGGGGGGDDVGVQSQGLTAEAGAPAGMSLNKKLLIGGGVLVGGFALWKLFGRHRKGGPKS